ncbi:DNA-directed RNA polymerase subunit delta [Mycoplasma sp. Ms02]|uniref:DNA-directed RNA polymerase subunit delta n=1 Tax=Mycoplasma sp. Ms02 TaxID=353851 RepID=UPI001C8985C1|nr:hypothetical protein [Mycoplasma sp. Ms02]QZE12532.1 hypothetical protein K4L35_00890 [Mycoplasma sp. Ms02]
MKTMLDIALSVVCEDATLSFEFDQIFEVVENNLKEHWNNTLVSENQSYDDLRVKKMGELYRLLTVDGRFVRDKDGLWSAREL